MALPRLGVAGALQLRLIDTLGDPLVDLRPHSVVDSAGVTGWWIASDLGEVARGQELGVNHVLGVGGDSTDLIECAAGSRALVSTRGWLNASDNAQTYSRDVDPRWRHDAGCAVRRVLQRTAG